MIFFNYTSYFIFNFIIAKPASLKIQKIIKNKLRVTLYKPQSETILPIFFNIVILHLQYDMVRFFNFMRLKRSQKNLNLKKGSKREEMLGQSNFKRNSILIH